MNTDYDQRLQALPKLTTAEARQRLDALLPDEWITEIRRVAYLAIWYADELASAHAAAQPATQTGQTKPTTPRPAYREH